MMRNRTLPVVNENAAQCDDLYHDKIPDDREPVMRDGRRWTLMLLFGPFPFFLWWFVFFMYFGPFHQYSNIQNVSGARTSLVNQESTNGAAQTTEYPGVTGSSSLRKVSQDEKLWNDENPSVSNGSNTAAGDKKSQKSRSKSFTKQEDKPKEWSGNQSDNVAATENTEKKPQTAEKRLTVPNLLIAGAQKSGTTAIAGWINLHRNVCKPLAVKDGKPIKEVHFFNADSNYEQGMDYYQKHYSHCTEETSLLVDATPDYLRQAERVRQGYDKLGGSYAKDLKILMILREPVAREYSWFNHMAVDVRKPNPPRYAKRVLNRDKNDGSFLSFNEYLDKSVFPELDSSFGHYSKWIKSWMDNFDRDQILILSYDELSKDPVSVLNRLRKFVNLEGKVKDIIAVHNKRSGKGEDVPTLTCKAKERLNEHFTKYNQELYELLEASPGPAFEQRPFPKFEQSTCEAQDK